MNIATRRRQRILEELSRYPSEIREAPARDDQLSEFETLFGPIPEEVRWFLTCCGGGVVGSEHIDGFDQIRWSNEKYKEEMGPEGWSMENVWIVGWDGGGNPIAVDRESGQVLIEDHTFGGGWVEAESFIGYLEKLLFKVRPN